MWVRHSILSALITGAKTMDAENNPTLADSHHNAPKGSSSSLSGASLPVWESMREELKRTGGQWLSDLARWYEADWLLALQGGEKPSAVHVLQVLAPEKRESVGATLSSIDSRYTQLLKEMDRATVRDNVDETIALPSRSTEDLPPTLAPGDRPQLDETIHLTQGPTANDRTLDLPGDLRTYDFSQGINVPKSLDFSVGTKGSKDKKEEGKESLPKISGYRVDRVLGRGGMGVVYLAHQLGVDRPVALKMILGGNFVSQAVVERFKAEARAVGRLQHENIVRIYESGWHGHTPYFSLEFIDGVSLSEKIAGKPLEPQEAASFAVCIGRALEYAHSAGIVHRDLKPANVLLTKDGVPKLSDFGLAKLENEQNDYSRTGDIVGTPGYMAPEQARGESSVAAPADVYGLGAILYCMLSGRPPFMAAKASDTLIQLLTKEPIAVAQLQPGVPRDLETICMKCLEKSPEKRYSSAAEMVADLQRFLNGEPIAARPVTKVERVWRWAKRKPMVASLSAIAATLGAVLMIGGPVVALVIDGQKRDIITAKKDAEDNANAALAAKELAVQNEADAIAAKAEAEENAVLARRAQVESEANAKLAKDNEEQAAKNAAAAQDQQKQAIDALKSLVFEVQRELKDRPRLQSLRKGLLDVARDGLKRMEASGADSTARNIISASIHRRLGDIQFEIGSSDAAIKEYANCLAILKELNAAGTLKGARHNMSTIYDLLGQASRKAGKLDDAEKYWQLSLEERRAWLVESKNNADVLQNVAATLGQLAILSREQGKLSDARKYLEENLTYRKEYVAQKPGQLDPQSQLLGTRRELALLRFAEGDADQGRDEMQRVVSEYEALASTNRDSQAANWNALIFKADLAMQLLYARQHDEALRLYSEVVEKQQKMVDEDPEKLQFREGLANTLYGLATVQQRKGAEPESLANYARALKELERVLESDPENLPRLVTAALFNARVRNYEAATKIVASLAPNELDAGIVFVVACVYSQLSTDKRTNSVDAKGQAIKMLDLALANGFDRPMDLQRDPDLDPLREEEKFKLLLSKK